jgi:thiol-disulfide isomerase/thioredoxin
MRRDGCIEHATPERNGRSPVRSAHDAQERRGSRALAMTSSADERAPRRPGQTCAARAALVRRLRSQRRQVPAVTLSAGAKALQPRPQRPFGTDGSRFARCSRVMRNQHSLPTRTRSLVFAVVAALGLAATSSLPSPHAAGATSEAASDAGAAGSCGADGLCSVGPLESGSSAEPSGVEPEVGASLLFFWGTGCAHCEEARPFVERLARERPELRVQAIEGSQRSDRQAALRRHHATAARDRGRRADVRPGRAIRDGLPPRGDRNGARTPGRRRAGAPRRKSRWRWRRRADEALGLVVGSRARPADPSARFFGDRDAIVAHERSAPLLLDRNALRLRPERDADRIARGRSAPQQLLSGSGVEEDLFG